MYAREENDYAREEEKRMIDKLRNLGFNRIVGNGISSNDDNMLSSCMRFMLFIVRDWRTRIAIHRECLYIYTVYTDA